MTFTQAKKILAVFGVSLIKTEYDEYRVNFKGDDEEKAYYTNNLKDAYNTGEAMIKERVKEERP